MCSIMDLAKTEAMLFKYGSGAGVNLCTIRGSQGEDVGRRHRQRPGQLHEGLRRLRRRGQVGRQDPPRGQDGHPRRRPSGRPRLHRLQGQRGEEGLGADRAGLRRLLHGRGLRLGLLPERQPLGARDGRLHARRRAGRRLDHPRGDSTASPSRRSRRARSSGDGRGRLALRRPGHPVRHHHQRLAHERQLRTASTRPTRARSTCSSTTRPATWPR